MRFRLYGKAILLLLVSATVPAQQQSKIASEIPSWLQALTRKDFQVPIDQGKFSASALSQIQREKIAEALKIPLQEQIEDYPENDQDVSDQANLPESEAARAAARRRLLDRSEILDLGQIQPGIHLYVVRVESTACGAQGANCPAFILEASQNKARYLGSAGGWGVAVHPIPGDPYPVLVFAWHMSASESSITVLRHHTSGYLSWLCGDLTSNDNSQTSKIIQVQECPKVN